MRINNEYLIYWDRQSKIIQNDYNIPIDHDANYDFAKTIDYFSCDSIDEINSKIIELNLIIPDSILYPW